MHLSPNQTTVVDVSQRRTCLLSALAKCQNVHIINKANGGGGEIRGVAEVNKTMAAGSNSVSSPLAPVLWLVSGITRW